MPKELTAEEEVVRERYQALVDKSFLEGLSPEEEAEEKALGEQIDQSYDWFYLPIIADLEAQLAHKRRRNALSSFNERYFQVTRPGGVTPVQATSFEEAVEEFREIAEDMLVSATKDGQPNWASPLEGATFKVTVKDLGDESEEEHEVTLQARKTDMAKVEFEGPQATKKTG